MGHSLTRSNLSLIQILEVDHSQKQQNTLPTHHDQNLQKRSNFRRLSLQNSIGADPALRQDERHNWEHSQGYPEEWWFEPFGDHLILPLAHSHPFWPHSLPQQVRRRRPIIRYHAQRCDIPKLPHQIWQWAGLVHRSWHKGAHLPHRYELPEKCAHSWYLLQRD